MKPLLSASKQDKTKIRQACKDIYNQLLDYRAAPSAHRGSQDAQSSLNVGFGNYRRRFAQVKHYKYLFKVLTIVFIVNSIFFNPVKTL